MAESGASTLHHRISWDDLRDVFQSWAGFMTVFINCGSLFGYWVWNAAQCGGLRRWGSPIPYCFLPVKTSNSEGLPRQRMPLCQPQRGSSVLADICGTACPWLRCGFPLSPQGHDSKISAFHPLPILTLITDGIHTGDTPLGIPEFSRNEETSCTEVKSMIEVGYLWHC